MEKVYCPVNGWDCPYWKDGNICSMPEEGWDPAAECDDYAAMNGDE